MFVAACLLVSVAALAVLAGLQGCAAAAAQAALYLLPDPASPGVPRQQLRQRSKEQRYQQRRTERRLQQWQQRIVAAVSQMCRSLVRRTLGRRWPRRPALSEPVALPWRKQQQVRCPLLVRLSRCYHAIRSMPRRLATTSLAAVRAMLSMAAADKVSRADARQKQHEQLRLRRQGAAELRRRRRFQERIRETSIPLGSGTLALGGRCVGRGRCRPRLYRPSAAWLQRHPPPPPTRLQRLKTAAAQAWLCLRVASAVLWGVWLWAWGELVLVAGFFRQYDREHQSEYDCPAGLLCWTALLDCLARVLYSTSLPSQMLPYSHPPLDCPVPPQVRRSSSSHQYKL